MQNQQSGHAKATFSHTKSDVSHDKSDISSIDLEGEYKSIQVWFSSVAQRNRKQTLTESARMQRISIMRDYLRFNEVWEGRFLSPDELLEKALENRKDAIERLTNYFNWTQGKLENIPPRKKKLRRNAAVSKQAFLRGFYTHNNVIFGTKEFPIPKRVASEVSKADALVPIYDYDEASDEIIFRNGLIQQLLSNLSFRDQTAVLGLLSTGADSTDLFSLTLEFVRKQWDEKRFFWNSNRLKDLEEFKTFFSREATAYLKRYVNQERKDAKDDDPLFIMQGNNTTRKMTSYHLALNLHRAAERMGYNEKSNPLRPKRFRHLFRTACGLARIDPGFIKAMMGHASDTSAIYLEKPKGLFLREYVKVEPHLTIFGIQKESLKEIEKSLKEEIDKLREDLRIANLRGDNLAMEIKIVKDQYNWLLDQFEMFKEKSIKQKAEEED